MAGGIYAMSTRGFSVGEHPGHRAGWRLATPCLDWPNASADA